MTEPLPRKIIHVDMDAFYASVEQRDDPALRGRPVVVAWRGPRSVVCAASYEARRFGVHSAMPAIRAERLCPKAVFMPPDFSRYRDVSRQIRNIFLRHTDLVEPLSLDEAYLDVSRNKTGLATATAVAKTIRAEIFDTTRLTASAGVAPNKFLAKIASDWRKPNGLFVIQPHEVLEFLAPLPVGKIPGVGKVMQEKLGRYGLRCVGDLRELDLATLEKRFGRYGQRLHELAHGIDRSRVEANRPVQSISAEDTFETDRLLHELDSSLRESAQRVWRARQRTARIPRTVVLKLKTADFRLITRSLTPPHPPADADSFTRMALSLLQRIDLPPHTRYRLAGVGLGNFTEAETAQAQGLLFDSANPASERRINAEETDVMHDDAETAAAYEAGDVHAV